MKSFLSKTYAVLAAPLRREWLFVLITTLLLAPVCVAGIARWPLLDSLKHWHLDLAGALRAFFFAYLLAAAVTLTGRRWLRTAAYALCVLTACMGAALSSMFGMDYSATVLTLVAETNTNEATGFIHACWGPKLWLFMALAVAAGAAIWLAPRAVARLPRPGARLRRGFLAAGMASMTAGAVLTAHSFRVWGVATQDELQDIVATYHADNPTKIHHAVATLAVTSREHNRWLDRMRRAFADMEATQMPLPADSLDIVLVIGESYARSHSQLYGYRLPTTPFQLAEQQAGHSVRFDSVYSTARRTSPSMRALLSLSDETAGEGWTDSVFLPLVFRRAGWDVVMLDNQRVQDATVTGYTLNAFLYNRWLTDSVYTFVSDRSYPDDDMQFVDSHKITPPHHISTSPRRLYIYHLWGQHIPACDRVPDAPGNHVFAPADYTWRREPWLTGAMRGQLAGYDNAMLYGDRVLACITARHAARPAVVIFISDHGEEIYDFRPVYGRVGATSDILADPALLRRYTDVLYGVPLTIWTSPRYRELYPADSATFAAAARRPGSLGLLGYTLLRLARISTPHYRPDRDILAPEYVPARGMEPARVAAAE